jgi:hypothetical protein
MDPNKHIDKKEAEARDAQGALFGPAGLLSIPPRGSCGPGPAVYVTMRLKSAFHFQRAV